MQSRLEIRHFPVPLISLVSNAASVVNRQIRSCAHSTSGDTALPSHRQTGEIDQGDCRCAPLFGANHLFLLRTHTGLIRYYSQENEPEGAPRIDELTPPCLPPPRKRCGAYQCQLYTGNTLSSKWRGNFIAAYVMNICERVMLYPKVIRISPQSGVTPTPSDFTSSPNYPLIFLSNVMGTFFAPR